MNRHFWSSLIVLGTLPIGLSFATNASPAAAQTQSQRIPISTLTAPRTQLAQEPNVTISGRVAQIVGNEFGLSDLSGQIVVQVGSDRQQRPSNLAVGQQITVTGQLDQSGKFLASRIVLPNGNVINVPTPNTDQSLQPQ